MYVHGFNNSQANITNQVNRLSELFEAQLTPVRWLSLAGRAKDGLLADWPMLSALLYPLDNWHTRMTDIATGSLEAAVQRSSGEIRIVAHSRGCFVVCKLLKEAQNSQMQRIKRVALLHPDVDRQTVMEIPHQFRYHLCIFETVLDYATTVSSAAGGAIRRLRGDDPIRGMRRFHEATLLRFRYEDDGTASGNTFSHSAWLDEPELVNVVRDWLESGRQPKDLPSRVRVFQTDYLPDY